MRKLDSKFHLDGEQSIKTSNGEPIPEDEPVVILRARDRLIRRLLRRYQKMCVEDGCSEYQLSLLRTSIMEFDEFAKVHPERMKQPGCTMGGEEACRG